MAKIIKKEKRDKIVVQALQEILHARRYKQGRVASWQKNENLYYGKKVKTEESRANVDLGQMQEHVHTLLSKIDSPLTFKFMKRKEAQGPRVDRLNALKDFDTNRNYWDIKDIAGKKQCIIYGRAIYAYAASSDKAGYQPHLDNVDVYDFLIDPDAGGIDLERGRYMGRYGVVKDINDMKKDSAYIQTVVKELAAGSGNADESSHEKNNKNNRTYANEHKISEKNMSNKDKFVFWEWYTTYEGERYYLLLTESGGKAIRVEPLKELFESELWPFWTFAAIPDLTEFWTPSPCDYVRELIMAQSVSINQMLDNAERVNRPMRVVDTSAVSNLAELKYRKDGYIKSAQGMAANAIKIQETPSIETPLKVFATLESIKASASGVTAGAKGVEDTDGRATIYEGNQQNVADRFGLFNKSYSFGYKRFAVLFEHGVREHLSKKIAVDIIGPEGIEVKDISRRDIFRKNDEFAVMTEQSNSELALSDNRKRSAGAFYSALLGQQGLVNQKVIVERLGAIAGEDPDTIRQLLDIDRYGNSKIMTEAERDIESILDGKNIRPNRMANAAYKQRFVDYILDHEEDMDNDQVDTMLQYLGTLDEVIVSNTARAAQDQARQEQEAALAGGGAQRPAQLRQPGPAQPLQDVIQQNVR